MQIFSNKCVVVTGAASGFGTAIAEKFAAAGASVVVADLNLEGAQAVAGRLPSAIAVQIDVADEAQNVAMAAAAVAAFGSIDVVCANAVCPVSAPTGFDLNATGTAELPEEADKGVIAGIPMGRRAVPQDVADAIFFLASDEARFLTGVCLDGDGGRSIQ